MSEQAKTVRLPEGTDPFWEGLFEGRLVLPKCGGCSRIHYYPRNACPFCHSRDLAWTECKPEGRIYSVTTYRRSEKPVRLAYVEVLEGIRMLGLLTGPDDWQPKIGDPVRLLKGVDASPAQIVFGPGD